MGTQFAYTARRKRILRQFLLICCPVVFAATIFAQVAFATTYIINDGDRVYTYTGFSGPAAALDRAGLALDERDSYTAETSVITVNRAQQIRILYHGQPITAVSERETVGELLKRLGIPITGQDQLSHSPDAPTFDGMELYIDKILVKQQRSTTVVPRQVITCSDPQLPAGSRETLVVGRDGELLTTADVTYKNGEEIQRKVLREEIITAPIPAIVSVGTGPAEPVPGKPIISNGVITLLSGQILTYTRTGTVRATAYTHTDKGCNMTTATGSTVHVGTVAVDPRFIPYGTRMFIVAEDGSYIYGLSEAEDCGGDIVGDRVDLYLPTFEECMEFGRRTCTVYFLG